MRKMVASGWIAERILPNFPSYETPKQASYNSMTGKEDDAVVQVELWQVSKVLPKNWHACPYSDSDLENYMNSPALCWVRGAHDTGETQHQR